jgi:hypothetical protein
MQLLHYLLLMHFSSFFLTFLLPSCEGRTAQAVLDFASEHARLDAAMLCYLQLLQGKSEWFCPAAVNIISLKLHAFTLHQLRFAVDGWVAVWLGCVILVA